MKILITGVAGFIGMNVANRLLQTDNQVIGIDNLNNYYDINLKKARLQSLTNQQKNFIFKEMDIVDISSMKKIFKIEKFDCVVNLAAQAGVRYSIENPKSYIDSNISGFLNILENCRHNNIKHLVFASSSSVYGINTKLPFSENDNTDHPLSLYGATKKSNELMAHAYSNLYSIPCTGLRFFTVYGPWGRPDMALFIFTKSILLNQPIQLFNNGNMSRDFTYIDDIVEGIVRVIYKPPTSCENFNSDNPLSSISSSPYKIFNIGNNNPSTLINYISALEEALGKSAIKEFLPMQLGDVHKTSSDTSKLEAWVDFIPKTSIRIGIKNFVNWYKNFYQI